MVTLLTDFGTADGYAGAMKGAVLSVCPEARLVDISHELPAGDLRSGALALMAAAPYFPEATVHLAVIDPGVGTSRAPLLVEACGQYFVGPNNGLLSLATPRPRTIRVLDRSEFFALRPSPTFHGRDIFAPVAGHLAAGTPAAELGSELATMEQLELPEPRVGPGSVEGQVLVADRFGNLLTNIDREHLGQNSHQARVEIGGRTIAGLVSTYGEAREGELVALFSSSGVLEIAVSSGSAREIFGPDPPEGMPVVVRFDRPGQV